MNTLHRWASCLVILISTLMATHPAQAIEQPRYQVERSLEDRSIEVRRYEPYLVAEVVVPGPAEQAGNQGFALLGAYIFGRNQGDRKIAMTAPVTQAAQSAPSTKIEMTAPVAQRPVEAGAGFTVQFMMPSSYTLDTLPLPVDARVRLKEVPAMRIVAITYSGTWSQANYQEHLDRLKDAVAKAGLQVEGEPVYARYDAPFMPWFMRRNEIWFALK
jgi:effector-binding domain-containing protein